MLHLIPSTLKQWEAQRRTEARDEGLHVMFVGSGDSTIALFFNGPILCYAQQFKDRTS